MELEAQVLIPSSWSPNPQNHHPRCVCLAIVCVSNAALSFHLGAEFKKNQAGREDPFPSINLREGRGRQRRNAATAKGFSVTLPPLLIQNIIFRDWRTFFAAVIHFAFLRTPVYSWRHFWSSQLTGAAPLTRNGWRPRLPLRAQDAPHQRAVQPRMPAVLRLRNPAQA